MDIAAGLLWKIALIAGAGLGAQWLAWRLQFPSVFMLIAAGLLLGPVSALSLGAPVIDPEADFNGLVRPAIAIAFAIVLFEAGLNLSGAEVRAVPPAARRLALAGVIAATLLGAIAARLFAGLPWDIALLAGAIFAASGPATVAPLLRRSRLSAHASAILRGEAALGKPAAILLAVLAFALIRTEGGLGAFLGAIAGAAAGAVLGAFAGWGLAAGFRRGHAPEFLKAPAVFAALLGVFVLASTITMASGFFAVAAFGVMLANARIAPVEEMRHFRDSVGVILISGAAVLIAAALSPRDIVSIGFGGLVFVLAMLVLVRPLAAAAATTGAQTGWRERLLAMTIAPRGAGVLIGAGFFAAELAASGRAAAEMLLPLAVLLVLASIAAQGALIGPLARRLSLARGKSQGVIVVGSTAWSAGLAEAIAALGAPVTIADPSYRKLKPAREAGVQSFIGEVLSEQADHRLDHASFGHLLAATPNDAYNALVCVQFAPELGRMRVWQLAVADDEHDGKSIGVAARGRMLIRPGRGFESLTRDWWTGWRFRAAKLSDTYTLDDLKRDRPDADLVLEQRPDGAITFLGSHTPPRGLPGSTVVTFGPPRADAAAPAEDTRTA